MNNQKIKVCFSGPRLLDNKQVRIVKDVVIKYHNYFEKKTYNIVYNVGDASGVDSIVFNTLSEIYNNDFIKKFIVKDKSKKQEYAQR